MTLKDSENDASKMSSTKVLQKLKQSLHKGGDTKAAEDPPVDEEATEVEEDKQLSYFMEHLTPDMEEEARTQLNETEETRTKGLEELRKLIKKDHHLVTYMHDNFLLQFLRARKFNVKRSFKLLQNFWSFRREYSHMYEMSDPKSIIDFIIRSQFGFLTWRDKRGCVVVVFKVGAWDPEEDAFEQMFRALSGCLVHAIKYPATQVCGFRAIIDLRELSWKQMKICTPANIMLLVRSTQFCFPGRYKGVHILSENKLFKTAWAVTQPLLTSKLRKRVMLHGTDLSPLSKYIHPSVLPEEFGGQAKPFNNEGWREVIPKNVEYVMDMLNYGYKK